MIRGASATRLSATDWIVPDAGDMRFYYDWAGQILQGAPQQGAFYGLPGYPYLLAMLLAIPGSIAFQVILIQCLIDAGTATLMFRMAGRFAPAPGALWIGALAAGVWALYPPAQGYALSLMPSTWGTFLLWALASAMLATPVGRPIRWLALGVLTGLSALLISNLLMLGLFGLGCLGWAAWRREERLPGEPNRDRAHGGLDANGAGGAERGGQPESRPPAARTVDPTRGPFGEFARGRWVPATAALALLAGLALGTAPVWGFHRFVAHEPVFLSAHAGLNFFIGNNADANGYPYPPPGLRASQRGMLRDSVTLAEKESGRRLTRAEVSDFWKARAQAFIRENRGAWWRLQALKIRNFWNQFSYDDLGLVTLLRETHVILPGPEWGAIALLGLPGLILGVLLVPASRPVAAVILLHMASLLPVFVTERYRLPAAPGLCLFAAWLAVSTALHVRRGSWCFPAVAGLGLIGAAPLVLWPCREPKLLALEPYNSGVQALAHGDLARAEAKLARAASLVPGNAEVQFALGNLRMEQGATVEARNRYRLALELNPQHEGAWNNLGVIALREDRWQLAERFFRASLAADPDDAKTLLLLSRAIEAQGRAEEAAGFRNRAVQLDPRAARLRTE